MNYLVAARPGLGQNQEQLKISTNNLVGTRVGL